MTFDLFRSTHKAIWDQLEKIPGPEPSFPLGNISDFSGQPAWEVCASYAKRFGGVTKIWLAGTPALVLNDPKIIGDVLGSQDDRYYKDAPHDALAPIITAENMFIANGATWQYGRNHSPFSYPVFAGWLDKIFPILQQFVRRRIGQTTGEIPDLIAWVRRLCYDAFSLAIWGELLGDNSYSQFMELAIAGNHRMLELPVLQKIPPLSPEFYLRRSHWYEDFETRVAKAKSNPDPSANHLLGLTLEAGSMLTTQQLANQFSAPVYFGGVFSMASSIVYTLWCLNNAQGYCAALKQDLGKLDRFDESQTSLPLVECLSLDHALREALRLHPPVPLYFRNTNPRLQVDVGGHLVPPNTMLFISNWYLQRYSQHWDLPMEYMPQRWTDGGTQRNPLGSDYFFPFGRGPRTCIGQAFGMFFMKIAIAELLRAETLTLDPQWSLQSDYFFAVQHPKGLKATI